MLSSKYLIGVAWFMAHILCSVSNDVISKYLTANLHHFEITFFRFFFSVIGLLPFVLRVGVSSIKTQHLWIHLIRGILLFGGIATWTFSLSIMDVTTVTMLSFSIPIFTLILACIFLGESMGWPKLLATILGFVGVLVSLSAYSLHRGMLLGILAAISFASLDIINKRFVTQEPLICMMFYSAIFTAALAFAPMLEVWTTPTLHDLSIMFFLGAFSANLLLFCLLQAFAKVEASSLGPYRYLELLLSFLAGYAIFGSTPPSTTWYGGALIIASTVFIFNFDKSNASK